MRHIHIVWIAISFSVAASLPASAVAQQAAENLKGRVIAAKEAEIAARVDGRLVKIEFTPGQIVKKGDLLFEFDARLRRIALASAQAKQKVMEAQLQLAEVKLKNAQTLRERNVSSEIQFVEAQAQRDIGIANVDEAKSSVQTAQVQLEEMKLHAPIDGMMGRPLVREGAYLTLQALEQNRLAIVTQLNPIHVVADVPYEAYMKQRPAYEGAAGDSVQRQYTLILPNGEQYAHKGRLIPGSGEFKTGTQVMAVAIEFENAANVLRPGLAVTVKQDR